MLAKSAVKGILMLFLICGFLMLGGCQMNELNLSFDERQVLIFSGAREDLLDQGLLTNLQKNMLGALRQAKAFLATRYPNEEFEFLTINVSAPLKSPYVFTAKSVSMPDDGFAVRVVYDKDANTDYIVTESFYSDLKKEELFQLIEGVFKEFGLTAKANLTLDGLYGIEYDPALTVSEIMAKGMNLGVSGWVYVQGPHDIDACINDVAKRLTDIGVCGGFRIMLIEGIDLDEQIKAGARDKRYVTKEAYVSLYTEAGGAK